MQIRVCAVLPVLNEEKYIKRCVDSLLAQTFPLEILVLDGGSTDSTLEILQNYGDSIRVIHNPGKHVADARNLAMQHLGGDITHCFEIIGHSWVEPDHLEKRVQDLLDLEETLGQKVAAIGCLTESAGSESHVSAWIEGALRTPIGSGGGQFKKFVGRHQTKVPAFCLHNVKALRSVDGWDERFITSQDSDLSMRLISAGWQLWRSDVSCVYMHKRSSIKNWWKMSHRYGFWRTKVVLRHPKRIDPRELLPLLGLFLIFALPEWWYAPVAYASALLISGIVYSKSRPSSFVGIPICLVILHTAFTIGLFDGLVRDGKASSDRT